MVPFITGKALASVLGVTDRTLVRWVTEIGFPKPLNVSDKVKVWDEQEVNEWLMNKKKEQQHGNDGKAESRAV